MAIYKAGDIVKITRKSVGLTQDELSEGICSVETLSRIENGRYKIKQNTYRELMKKMNRISDKNYAICVGEKKELLDERYELEVAVSKGDYDMAKKYLISLKEKAEDNFVNRQYIENLQALIDYYTNKIDLHECIYKLEKIVGLTVGDYSRYIDSVYAYTEQEILIHMRIANCYAKSKEYVKSKKILEMLIRSIDTGYMKEVKNQGLRIVLLRNFACILEELELYDEAIKVFESLITDSVKMQYGHMIPIAMNGIVWCKIQMYENGNNTINMDEIKKIKRRAYYIAAAQGDTSAMDILKKSFEQYFDERIEIC